MKVLATFACGVFLVVAFAVSPRAQQNAPAAPVTNAPGIPGWAYPVAAGAPAPNLLLATGSAIVTITSSDGSAPPVVDAGPDQTVTIPNSIKLNGSAVDAKTPLNYLWSQTQGPPNGAQFLYDSTSGVATNHSYQVTP